MIAVLNNEALTTLWYGLKDKLAGKADKAALDSYATSDEVMRAVVSPACIVRRGTWTASQWTGTYKVGYTFTSMSNTANGRNGIGVGDYVLMAGKATDTGDEYANIIRCTNSSGAIAGIVVRQFKLTANGLGCSYVLRLSTHVFDSSLSLPISITALRRNASGDESLWSGGTIKIKSQSGTTRYTATYASHVHLKGSDLSIFSANGPFTVTLENSDGQQLTSTQIVKV